MGTCYTRTLSSDRHGHRPICKLELIVHATGIGETQNVGAHRKPCFFSRGPMEKLSLGTKVGGCHSDLCIIKSIVHPPKLI